MALQAPVSADRETVKVGTHLLAFEPPDVVFVRFTGDVTNADVERILDAFTEFATASGRAYLLIDVADVGHVTPEARRVAAMRQLPPAYAGLVVFGGTFQQQLVAKLATLAGWFLRGRALGKPMPVCVKDERTARAWLVEQRRAH
ncbi:STAS/SEC14 domain-containing protein [Polyangium sp. y55x31]|uniref:STAS/SEC14 domain-containing protein n=1 Tax=Polyangium sp. y55x31 TaxID=3042688 RepID=UPI0024830A4F|nr:STAS/SEC14 domain-containing protein [Polyangium sp. y55x31]MDI1477693.1 STAS/SEC14 domain-containing protein [Polyangium sp. y55x31]